MGQKNTFPVEVQHKGNSESELFDCFPQFGLFDFHPPLALPNMHLVVSLDQGGRSKLSIFSQVPLANFAQVLFAYKENCGKHGNRACAFERSLSLSVS